MNDGTSNDTLPLAGMKFLHVKNKKHKRTMKIIGKKMLHAHYSLELPTQKKSIMPTTVVR